MSAAMSRFEIKGYIKSKIGNRETQTQFNTEVYAQDRPTAEKIVHAQFGAFTNPNVKIQLTSVSNRGKA